MKKARSSRRVEMTGELLPLSIAFNARFSVDGESFQTVMHAFYSYVSPRKSNEFAHVSIKSLMSLRLCSERWEVFDDKKINMRLLNIVSSKCRMCGGYMTLLMSTKGEEIVGEQCDSYLGGYNNMYGLALMFLRDNDLCKYELKNIVGVVDMFEEYVRKYRESKKEARKQLNELYEKRYNADVGDTDEYAEFEPKYYVPKIKDGISDAVEFMD